MAEQVAAAEEDAGPALPWRDAWARAAAALPVVTVVVDNPTQAGSALSRYVTYRVRTTVTFEGRDEAFETTRRFSEFASLREALVQRYVGLLVPPIPPKAVQNVATMSSKMADAQTKRRLRILNIFAERLATLPWVADDLVLRSFCGVAKQSFLRVLEADDMAVPDEERGASNKGRALWYAAVARSEPVAGAPALAKRLGEVGPRLEGLAAGLKAAADAATAARKAVDDRAAALGTVAEGMAVWRGEAARFAALGLDPARATGAPEGPAGATSAALRCWAADSALEGDQLDVCVGAALLWQGLHLGALRELVGKRGLLLEELRKGQQRLQQLNQLKASGKPDQTNMQGARAMWSRASLTMSGLAKNEPKQTLDDQIATVEEKIREDERLIEQHARALAYSEFARFDAEHRAFTALWTRRFCRSARDLAAKTVASWDDALAALGPEPEPTRDALDAPGLVWDATAAAAADDATVPV